MIALIDGDIILGKVWLDGNGYPKVSIGSCKDNYVHRIVAALMLGRELQGTECVHHINYNKQDNRRSNLYVCKDDAEHRQIHAIQDILNDGYDPKLYHYCTYHKQYELKTEFSTRPSSWCGLHNMCRKATNEYRKLKGYDHSLFDWKAAMNQQFRRALKKGITSPLKEGRCL